MTTNPGGSRWRELLLGALLLGEFLWLVSRFTTGTLPESEAVWVQLMRKSSSLPQIGLAVATMLLLFRGEGIEGQPRTGAAVRRTRTALLLLLPAQLAAFALLVHSTAGIFEEQLVGVERPMLWIAVWALLALATALLGVLLFMPLATLARAASRRAGMLLGGCFLGLTAWWAGQYAANELGLTLRVPTLWLTDKLLGLFEHEYLVDAANFEIRTPRFWVNIAPQCSGFEGMGLMAVFATSYVWVFRRRLRFPQLLLLPVAGILGMWVLNVLRLVALVLIGTHGSPRAAAEGFHSIAGTLAFCLAALGLVAASSRLRLFSATDEQDRGLEEHDGTAAYLAPFLIAVAFGMIASAFGESGRDLQPLKAIAPAVAVWLFHRNRPITIPKGWGTALLVGIVAFALWVGIPRLDAVPGAIPGARAQELDPASLPSGIWLAIRVAGTVCVTPIVEELAFRGYLMRRLTAHEFETVTAKQITILAWASSSLLFGILHEHWVAATLAGALYGFAYMRRGQLFDCVLAHACTNLLLVVLAMSSGDWSIAWPA